MRYDEWLVRVPESLKKDPITAINRRKQARR